MFRDHSHLTSHRISGRLQRLKPTLTIELSNLTRITEVEQKNRKASFQQHSIQPSTVAQFLCLSYCSVHPNPNFPQKNGSIFIYPLQHLEILIGQSRKQLWDRRLKKREQIDRFGSF